MNHNRRKKDISCSSMGRWRGYVVIVGGILVHLSLGTVYTFGNMTPYMTSYMRKKAVSPELTYADSLWISAVATMGQGASVFIGGLVQRKLGTRLTTLLGGWISSGGVLLTYFTIKTSFGLTALTYGGLFGFGVGIAYAAPMGCGMKWLPDKKGLVNGLVVAGFGGGAFVFDQVQTAYLNPDNLVANKEVNNDKYFDQDSILDKVPSMFLVLGGCYAAMQVIGVICLKDPPADMSEQINRNEEETQLVASTTSVDVRDTDSTPGQVLQRKSFYMLWFLYLFNGQGIQFISSLYKTYGQTFIKDDRFLAVVGSLAAVCNGGGRILWGYLADKFCFKVASMLSCGVFCVCMLTFSLTERLGPAAFLVYICILFLSFSGNFSLLPTATAKCFGQKYYAINYGFVFTASIVTSPLGVVLTSNLQNTLGWYGLFFMVAAFSFTISAASILPGDTPAFPVCVYYKCACWGWGTESDTADLMKCQYAPMNERISGKSLCTVSLGIMGILPVVIVNGRFQLGMNSMEKVRTEDNGVLGESPYGGHWCARRKSLRRTLVCSEKVRTEDPRFHQAKIVNGRSQLGMNSMEKVRTEDNGVLGESPYGGHWCARRKSLRRTLVCSEKVRTEDPRFHQAKIVNGRPQLGMNSMEKVRTEDNGVLGESPYGGHWCARRKSLRRTLVCSEKVRTEDPRFHQAKIVNGRSQLGMNSMEKVRTEDNGVLGESPYGGQWCARRKSVRRTLVCSEKVLTEDTGVLGESPYGGPEISPSKVYEYVILSSGLLEL
ncbi:uncharacterized protein LOC132556890 [Ylistrum balloti]|uniref:uncharacterized protein LOC132556890 n=1 Tax=Ylistrum balloti TaxID=509963 RepID=UPI002905979B|nr:uncharacterized protein LOC132556890 [Ylistrum balloti]